MEDFERFSDFFWSRLEFEERVIQSLDHEVGVEVRNWYGDHNNPYANEDSFSVEVNKFEKLINSWFSGLDYDGHALFHIWMNRELYGMVYLHNAFSSVRVTKDGNKIKSLNVTAYDAIGDPEDESYGASISDVISHICMHQIVDYLNERCKTDKALPVDGSSF